MVYSEKTASIVEKVWAISGANLVITDEFCALLDN